MKTLFYLLIIFLLSPRSHAQAKGDNTIKVHGISFLEICNALLDAGYAIDKKDNELQTATSEVKDYDKYWNASYKVSLRVKDSIAYITGLFTAPGRSGGVFKDEPMQYLVNRKGEVQKKALATYPFLLLNVFALSLGKQVTYSNR